MKLTSGFLVLLHVFILHAECLVVPQYTFELPLPYVVVFKQGISSVLRESHISSLGVDPFSLGGYHGYFGVFTYSQLEIIRSSPLIDYVEEDHIGKFSETTVQQNSTWALSSISHQDIVPDCEFLYDTSGGEGVVAYVIDSGVKTSHEEFQGRAEWITAVTYPHLHIDYIGHGTHVAGIIGSKTFGVAKKVKIKVVGVAVGINVSISSLIKGIEVALKDHNQERKLKGFKGSVMNLSVAFPGSRAIDAAVQSAIDHGIHVAVGAGNDGKDACALSPARAKSPLCVGAIDMNNVKADVSNQGPCVDIFAPGYNVESTFITTKTAHMAGTSMSSPHVAGLLAYFLGLYPEKYLEFAMDVSPAMLKKLVLQYSTKGVIRGLDDATPNRLAYNGGGNSVW